MRSRKTIDPTLFVIRFERVKADRAQCSVCATPIAMGVRAMLHYPGEPPGGTYLLLCDDCAEACGELAWDEDGTVIELPVGGNCCTVRVE